VNRACLVIAAAALLSAAPAAAQDSQANSPFLSRFDFWVAMEYLSHTDPRFVWDARWAAELDLIDYRRGRVTFGAEYETVLGEEFRAFDPNQGNYMLEGAASVRLAHVEVAGVFHHVSRHLSDRPKRFPVDWNMIGGRAHRAFRHGRTDIRARADLRGVIQHTYVDYSWELDAEAAARVRLRPRVAAIASGNVRVIGVDGSRGRGTQHGVRGEGGVRFDGGAAALELFVAGERRIDPYQLEFSTTNWLSAGFRLTSR
jgi:hypothetical protein